MGNHEEKTALCAGRCHCRYCVVLFHPVSDCVKAFSNLHGKSDDFVKTSSQNLHKVFSPA